MKNIVLLIWCYLMVGCVHDSDELDGSSLEHGITFDDILSDRGVVPPPNVMLELEELLVTPESIAAVPPSVRAEPDLTRYAITRLLSGPELLDRGVYGVRGREKVFIASRSDIKDRDRLYWAMVRVLSEKYGCFMTGRWYVAKQTMFSCRDGRQISFVISEGPDWLQFASRQYDRQGFEIEVKKRRIVRVSPTPVLY